MTARAPEPDVNILAAAYGIPHGAPNADRPKPLIAWRPARAGIMPSPPRATGGGRSPSTPITVRTKIPRICRRVTRDVHLSPTEHPSQPAILDSGRPREANALPHLAPIHRTLNAYVRSWPAGAPATLTAAWDGRTHGRADDCWFLRARAIGARARDVAIDAQGRLTWDRTDTG